MSLAWAGEFEQFERIIAADPGARGVAPYCQRAGLFRGELRSAAERLATPPHRVLIVTGFCVVDLPEPVAETDGPLGALYLAAALQQLGHQVTLVTDPYGEPPLTQGLRDGRFVAELAPVDVFSAPLDIQAHEGGFPGWSAPDPAWFAELFEEADFARPLTLVSIERVGPNHDLETLAATGASPTELAEFAAAVTEQQRDCPHNMRGMPLRAHTAPLHLLFEKLPRHCADLRSVGVFDGGNEIGCGRLSWREIRDALGSGLGGQIACRVPTDWGIPCGVSNWGAYALALGALLLAGKTEVARAWTAENEQRLLDRLVQQTAIVDGVSRQNTPTVDGLSSDDYLFCLRQLRRTAGLAD